MKKKRKKHILTVHDKPNRISQKTGLPPGSLIHVGKHVDQPISIYEMIYMKDEIKFRESNNLSDCLPIKPAPSISWLDVAGIDDRSTIDQVGHALELHPLTMEDIMNTQQRAKMEEYDNYIFFSLKAATADKNTGEITYSQLSMIVGENYVITFQENRENDVLASIRMRIQLERSRLESMGNDFLVYSIIDTLVDGFFDITDIIEDSIDDFDEMVINEQVLNLQDMYRLKRSIIQLRKCVVPLRDILTRLLRRDNLMINKTSELYFVDVHDHVLRISENLEVYREIMNSLHETYLSSISNRMNAVMKVLTVISTIFIPLTFIVGVYGTNFPNIPEFRYPHAYLVMWGIMLALVVFMLAIFRRNKWL
jgi:magnesium transporter